MCICSFRIYKGVSVNFSRGSTFDPSKEQAYLDAYCSCGYLLFLWKYNISVISHTTPYLQRSVRHCVTFTAKHGKFQESVRIRRRDPSTSAVRIIRHSRRPLSSLFLAVEVFDRISVFTPFCVLLDNVFKFCTMTHRIISEPIVPFKANEQVMWSMHFAFIDFLIISHYLFSDWLSTEIEEKKCFRAFVLRDCKKFLFWILTIKRSSIEDKRDDGRWQEWQDFFSNGGRISMLNSAF